MNEQELLEGFKAVFKVCGLRDILCKSSSFDSVVAIAGGPTRETIDVDQLLSSLAHDCVETVRAVTGVHALAALAAQVKAEKGRKYEHDGNQVAMSLPYGASSILTELYKKLMALIVADKAGTLTLESSKEELVDMTNWQQFLWDYLERRDNV